MDFSNPIPDNFKYLHEDAVSRLFVDIDTPDGESLVLESYGFAMCERVIDYPSFWSPWGDDILRMSRTPEVWIRLDNYTITQALKPRYAI